MTPLRSFRARRALRTDTDSDKDRKTNARSYMYSVLRYLALHVPPRTSYEVNPTYL